MEQYKSLEERHRKNPSPESKIPPTSNGQSKKTPFSVDAEYDEVENTPIGRINRTIENVRKPLGNGSGGYHPENIYTDNVPLN